MSTLASIAAWSIWAFGLLLLGLQMTVYMTGFRLGKWRNGRPGNQPESIAVVVGGMLALLAFVLALTLSFASARFNERRAGTLVEANAISTAWLRAEAVGGARGREIARLLEQYLTLREDFAGTGRDRARLNDLNRQTDAAQSVVWGHVTGIVNEQPNPVTVSLMSALNDAFDASTAERFAFELKLPPQIFWLLIVLTLTTTACVGYQFGLRGTSQYVLVTLLSMMWTAVIVNILDLASSRLGYYRTDTAPYEWARQGFQAGITIPPLSNPH